MEETTINDGRNEEDLLAASFGAAEHSCTLSPYGIDDSNLMSYSVIEDGDSPSGKALVQALSHTKQNWHNPADSCCMR